MINETALSWQPVIFGEPIIANDSLNDHYAGKSNSYQYLKLSFCTA